MQGLRLRLIERDSLGRDRPAPYLVLGPSAVSGPFASIAARGFNNSTVQTICDEAGLSRGLISHYFKGKDEVLYAMVRFNNRLLMEDVIARMRRATTSRASSLACGATVCTSAHTSLHGALREATGRSSEVSCRLLREVLKPTLELLSAVPTVVYGYFALVVVTPTLQHVVPGLAGFNALVDGLVRRRVPDRVRVASAATASSAAFPVSMDLLEPVIDRVVELVGWRVDSDSAPTVPGRWCADCHLLGICPAAPEFP